LYKVHLGSNTLLCAGLLQKHMYILQVAVSG